MKKAKTLALLVSAACLISASGVSAIAANWAEESYSKYVSAGVFTDTAELKNISAPITRGEFIRSLDEILDWDWTNMAYNTFTDMTYAADGTTYLSDMDLFTDILKAVGEGVISGTQDHKVLPFNSIKRQDACVILCKAFGIEPVDGETSFADNSSIASYAKGYVNAISSLGYVKGSNNNFMPTGEITYGQCAAIFDNMSKDYSIISERAERAKTNWLTDNCTEITVATVDTYAGDTSAMLPNSYTYEGGWIETDANGKIITEATGTKDLNIRLWLPEGTKAGDNVPVMLYTFGGSWIRGTNQSINPFLVEYMVEHGVAVASLTYRYEQEACFPYSLYDLQAQVRYLKIHANELGIDADTMGVSGCSAGGYWAAELAVTGNEKELQDPGYVTFEGDQLGMLTEITYCGCQYGAFNMFNCADYVDFRIQDYQGAINQHDRAVSNDPNVMGTYAVNLKPSEIYDAYVNGTEDATLAMMAQRFVDGSPIYQVDANDPSFFFYHGTNDGLCPLNQAVEMYGTLCAAGVENNVLRVCEGMGHGRYTHPQYYLEMMDWMISMSGK